MSQCSDIQLLLHEYELRSPAEALKVRTHIAECTGCRADRQQFQRMHRALRALEAPAARPPQRVEQALQPLFRGQAVSRRPWQRSTGLAALALGVVLLAVVVGRDLVGPGALQNGAAASPAPDSSDVQLLVREGRETLVQLDPATLAGHPGAPRIDFGGEMDLVAASPSSGLVAAAVYEDQCCIKSGPYYEGTVQVWDARSGERVARFELPSEPAVNTGLAFTRDGTQLSVPLIDSSRDGPLSWLILDPYSGRVLRQIGVDLDRAAAGSERAWMGPHSQQAWLGPHGQRAYALVVRPGEHSEEGHPVLLAFEGESRKLVGRLELTDVLLGPHTMVREEEPPRRAFTAQSPDGRRLAVLHENAATLTLVDLQQMQVISTRPLSYKRGLPSAHSAGNSGRFQPIPPSLAFSRNGRQLYLTGFYCRGDAGPERDCQPTGIQRIDIETAQITAEALAGHVVLVDAELPDKRTLYVTAYSDGRRRATSVYRLDAQTLTIRAKHDLVRANPGGREPSVFMLPPAAEKRDAAPATTPTSGAGRLPGSMPTRVRRTHPPTPTAPTAATVIPPTTPTPVVEKTPQSLPMQAEEP